MADENSIAAVERAADILDYLYERGGECSISAISADLSLYKSTVHRMLQTLKSRAFVYQNPVTQQYGLGLRLFLLGSRVAQNTATVELVKPIAQSLVEKYNECIHITVPYTLTSRNELPKQLLLGKVMNPNNVLTVSPPVGATAFCHSSASGKCMLAFGSSKILSQARSLELLRFTETTITDWRELDFQLLNIRKNGFATEDGETELGLSCTAVPVQASSGVLSLVLSMSGPTSRLRALPQDLLVADLKLAAAKIAMLLN